MSGIFVRVFLSAVIFSADDTKDRRLSAYRNRDAVYGTVSAAEPVYRGNVETADLYGGISDNIGLHKKTKIDAIGAKDE